MPFESFIAGRYLRAKRKQTFISLITVLSVVGVAVGVMALVVVIAVMSGAESDFRSRILGVESHIILMKHGGGFDNYREALEKVRTTEGVNAATPFVFSQVMLRSSAGMSGAMLRGVEAESAGRVIKNFNALDLEKKLSVETESETGEKKLPGMILGKVLAQNIGVSEGDTIQLVIFRRIISPLGHQYAPTMKTFVINGLFDSGMQEYDGMLAYVNMKSAQKLLRIGDSITGIGIWVDDIYKARDISLVIKEDFQFPFWIRDWMQMNQSLFSALELEKTAMFVILILIVLVAAFNIASSLIMMVMEKTKDIAILKTMGATSRNILKIFVFEGMVIGFIGTFLGIFSGVGVCMLLKKYEFIELPEAYPFSTLPVQLESFDVLIIAVSSMVICFLSTLYPAYQASKLNPVEAIRYG